jgi:hypothetical protein
VTSAGVSPGRWTKAARVWWGILALIMAASFLTQLVLVLTGGVDANSGVAAGGVGVGTRLARLFSYFTIQSNLIALAAATTLMLAPYRDGRFWRVLRLDSLLGIVITGLVYDIMLAGMVDLTGLALAVTLGLHYVAPWGTLLGWLLFGPRPRIDRRTVVLGFLWPAAWIAYTFGRGAISGWYPYPFLDVNALGLPLALRNTAIVLVVGLLLAVVLKLLDRLPTLGQR